MDVDVSCTWNRNENETNSNLREISFCYFEHWNLCISGSWIKSSIRFKRSIFWLNLSKIWLSCENYCCESTHMCERWTLKIWNFGIVNRVSFICISSVQFLLLVQPPESLDVDTHFHFISQFICRLVQWEWVPARSFRDSQTRLRSSQRNSTDFQVNAFDIE